MSVANTINIAKVCTSLTIRAIEQGLEKDLLLPRKLDISQKVVNDIYTGDPTNSDLTLISNQLFAMCGGYAFEAQRILNLGGAGIVGTTPSGNGLIPFPISHLVTVGESGVMTISSTDWIGLQDVNQVVINQNVFQVGAQFNFNSLNGTLSFALSGYTLQTGDIITSLGFKSV